MDTELGVLSYMMTAALSGGGGFLAAGYVHAPKAAELTKRVEVAERGLYNQGLAIRELSEALRGLLHELERDSSSLPHSAAMTTARDLLSKR